MVTKIKALANFLGCKKKEIEQGYDEDTFEYFGSEYKVYTDSEADDAFENYIDQYIDDCVLHEIPESYRQYFDRQAFTKDCEYDGRGHFLAGYDGVENEQDGYYIYQTN